MHNTFISYWTNGKARHTEFGEQYAERDFYKIGNLCPKIGCGRVTDLPVILNSGSVYHCPPYPDGEVMHFKFHTEMVSVQALKNKESTMLKLRLFIVSACLYMHSTILL